MQAEKVTKWLWIGLRAVSLCLSYALFISSGMLIWEADTLYAPDASAPFAYSEFVFAWSGIALLISKLSLPRRLTYIFSQYRHFFSMQYYDATVTTFKHYFTPRFQNGPITTPYEWWHIHARRYFKFLSHGRASRWANYAQVRTCLTYYVFGAPSIRIPKPPQCSNMPYSIFAEKSLRELTPEHGILYRRAYRLFAHVYRSC